MRVRKLVRESAFRIARHDLALFLQDHEDHLLAIFREEMQQLDEQIPEESLFIDIKMVPLGEAILKSALHAITRFLIEDYDQGTLKTKIPVKSSSTAPVSLVDD
jgi:hypothetical protein